MDKEKTKNLLLHTQIGNVTIGRGLPVVVQSMTASPTRDIEQTLQEIIALADAGSQIVRITVNDLEAARAVPLIKEKLLKRGYKTPIAGCFHYNGHQLLKEVNECALALDKYRINPGNVGFGEKRDKQFEQIIEIAIKHQKPVRIGVNWGSLDKSILNKLMEENAQLTSPRSSQEVLREAIILSTISSAQQAENIGLSANKIIVSAKVSRVPELVIIYRELFKRCQYPLHLGLTEAGIGDKGAVSTVAALAILLNEGIGDTIRASITPYPGQPRTAEVKLCLDVLQSLGIRNHLPEVTACPGCGRTNSDYFRRLAAEVENMIKEKINDWRPIYPDVVNLKIAVMGCIVNGPGESKHANIGISLPGEGEQPVAPVFVDGEKKYTLRGETITRDFCQIIDDYVKKSFSIRSKD